jgi:hypothetical protein
VTDSRRSSATNATCLAWGRLQNLKVLLFGICYWVTLPGPQINWVLFSSSIRCLKVHLLKQIGASIMSLYCRSHNQSVNSTAAQAVFIKSVCQTCWRPPSLQSSDANPHSASAVTLRERQARPVQSAESIDILYGVLMFTVPFTPLQSTDRSAQMLRLVENTVPSLKYSPSHT